MINRLPNNMISLMSNDKLTRVVRDLWNTNFARCVVRVTGGKGIRVDEQNGEVVISATSENITGAENLEPQPAPAPTGNSAIFGEITAFGTVVADAKWVYGIRMGTYTASGGWTLQTGAAGTVTAYNTIETNNATATAKGGDGVQLPPVTGALTRLPVGGSSSSQAPVVPLFRSPDGGYFFCVPNPFVATCDE